MDLPSPSKFDEAGIAIPGRQGEYLDPRTLSTTPGGSIYGTTPGGTKIFYNRDQLMFLARSPLAQTPPSLDFPKIPGVTCPADTVVEEEPEAHSDEAPEGAEDDQGMFPMD
mmetsp:Transcript_12620/g.50456  ORF Transcript_12620/g.50456 Transcript_12620/m.50456 type:complete len:111 (-) Transcript_12620:182-514(-)